MAVAFFAQRKASEDITAPLRCVPQIVIHSRATTVIAKCSTPIWNNGQRFAANVSIASVTGVDDAEARSNLHNFTSGKVLIDIRTARVGEPFSRA